MKKITLGGWLTIIVAFFWLAVIISSRWIPPDAANAQRIHEDIENVISFPLVSAFLYVFGAADKIWHPPEIATLLILIGLNSLLWGYFASAILHGFHHPRKW